MVVGAMKFIDQFMKFLNLLFKASISLYYFFFPVLNLSLVWPMVAPSTWLLSLHSMTLTVFLIAFMLSEIQDALGSCYVFPPPVLESATCPRDPSYFYWTMILENNIWGLGALLLQDQLTERVYVCIYIHKCFSICHHLYLY